LWGETSVSKLTLGHQTTEKGKNAQKKRDIVPRKGEELPSKLKKERKVPGFP